MDRLPPDRGGKEYVRKTTTRERQQKWLMTPFWPRTINGAHCLGLSSDPFPFYLGHMPIIHLIRHVTFTAVVQWMSVKRDRENEFILKLPLKNGSRYAVFRSDVNHKFDKNLHLGKHDRHVVNSRANLRFISQSMWGGLSQHFSLQSFHVQVLWQILFHFI